jgi:predicted hydrolase (HD superfamily)
MPYPDKRKQKTRWLLGNYVNFWEVSTVGWIPDRTEALDLLKRYNKQESLIKHALAVEAVMRHFSTFFAGADADEWGNIGLLHDLDYEQYPDLHCQKTGEILKDLDMEPHLVRAILSHGYGICTDIKPETDLEKVLFTIDELTGLVTASVLMRPSRSILDAVLCCRCQPRHHPTGRRLAWLGSGHSAVRNDQRHESCGSRTGAGWFARRFLIP